MLPLSFYPNQNLVRPAITPEEMGNGSYCKGPPLFVVGPADGAITAVFAQTSSCKRVKKKRPKNGRLHAILL
jgi:hypothetical protein